MSQHIHTPPPHIRTQSGYMLLEILVTVGVLSIGLLGLAALQMSSLKASDSAVMRSQAAIRIAEMTNRMRANAPAVTAGNYHLGTGYVANPNPASVNAQANTDITTLWTQISGAASHGAQAQLRIDCPAPLADTAQQLCVIGIQWPDERGDPQVNEAYAATAGTNMFTHEAQVLF